MRVEALRLVRGWVERVSPPDAAAWFAEALAEPGGAAGERASDRAFALAPRRLGNAGLRLDEADLAQAERVRPGLDPRDWSLDEAARIAILLAAAGEGTALPARVRRLARTADLRETAALMRGLPLYPGADDLVDLARTGVRSGIAPVFDAIALRNPFPAERFDEGSWNQMILKALFMERPLRPVHGLERRANPALTAMLVDYAHERWSAGRPVPHALWHCVGMVPDCRGLEALERAATGDGEDGGRHAAAEALRACRDPRAAEIRARLRIGVPERG